MAKPKAFSEVNFLKMSPEEQAKAIERETRKLLNQLPSLKKNLQVYNDVSSELYNLSPDEVELYSTSWAKAVRTGSINTETGKQAYLHFVKNLYKYARPNIRDLAIESAEMRMDSWIENIRAGSTENDKAYAEELLNGMTEEEKVGFTRSKYFMDSSYMYMVTEEDGNQYSIQTLKLELYLEEVRGKTTRHIYRTEVKHSEDPLRRYHKKPKKG